MITDVMPELIVFLRSRELARHPIVSAEVTIGRDHSADLTIDNAGVSRTHAVVSYRDGAFHIRDSGSQNGITLNGRPVQEAELSYGDVVGVNKFKIHFSADGGVPPDMLSAPTKQVGDAPGNVVATMTVNADAARQMQRDFIRKKRGQAGAAAPAQQNQSSWGWLWWASVAVVLIVLAIYRSR